MFDIFPIDAASLVLGFLIGLGALGILVLASLNNMLMIQKKKHSKRAFTGLAFLISGLLLFCFAANSFLEEVSVLEEVTVNIGVRFIFRIDTLIATVCMMLGIILLMATLSFLEIKLKKLLKEHGFSLMFLQMVSGTLLGMLGIPCSDYLVIGGFLAVLTSPVWLLKAELVET
jgi:hypothetical protein